MGVWAFYKGLPQRDLDAIRADVQQPIEEIALSDEPTVQCEIGKAWYRLHEILTQGLTEPTENNIYIVKTELYRTGSFVVGLSNHNDRYP